jgi:acyl-CoA synthetase (AMP-forming)/AMP-acid ligase II
MALADERMTISWAELDILLNRVTNALLGAGLGAHDRIGVFAPNSCETVLAYQAGLHAGISSVPINFHLTAEEVAYILTDSNTRILFVAPETEAVGRRAAELAGVETVIGWRCPAQPGLLGWTEWRESASDAPPPTDMPPRPHLHYTSGTTGRPKGTETPPNMFPGGATVADFFANLREIFAANGSRSPALAVSPMYHTGSLGSVRAVGGGQALAILSRFDAENVLRTIDRHRVQGTLMVPTHFQRLLALPPETRRKYDVSSLLLVAHTGAACPRDVKRQMIEWFGPVLMEAYGATESGTTNLITSEEWLLRPGSVGKTLPQFELIVVDEEGRRLGANQIGNLYFRDKTGRGIVYHNDPEKTRAAHLEPGVFTLGEVGYFDDEGYVFITDRVSDMIVSGGVNIYPAETEQVLIQHPGVADVAVIGTPNADMGEEVKALIVPRDLVQPPQAADLDRFCRERLAGYKCPRSYDIVDDIGRNAMGKVNKKELKRRYWPTDRTIGG